MATNIIATAPTPGQTTPPKNTLKILNRRDATQTVATITAVLVTIVALLAFVLSYSSLQHMAAANGIDGWLSYAWPLLLDFAMVVFSLAILRANLRQESAKYPWTLTIVAASLATLANILDVTNLGLPPVAVAAGVKALAPVALVLSFELLMQMIRAELKRSEVVESIADLYRQRQNLTADVERLTAERNRLNDKRDSVKAELAELRREKRAESNPAPATTTEATKEQALVILAERSTITGTELGRMLGKSESLGRRLKRELLPLIDSVTGTSGNGNGHVAELGPGA